MSADFDPKTFWEARLRKTFSLGSVGYAILGEQYNNWLYRVRRRVFNHKIKALPGGIAEAAVLDVGSGTGFYIDRWKELGARSIVGSDLTSVAADRLQDKYPDVSFCELDISGDIGCLDGRRFDIVSALDVLFHIVDDGRYRRALNNISRLLARRGLLIFSDNFIHGQEIRGESQVNRSLETIEKAVADAGLEIIDRAPMFVLMNAPVDSRNRLLRKFWNKMAWAVQKSELVGYLFGAALYPFELLAVRLLKESPTTELAICRKAN